MFLQQIHRRKLSAFALSFVVCIFFSGKGFAQFLYEPSPRPVLNTSINEFSFFQNSAFPKIEQVPGLEGEQKVIQPSHKSAFLAVMLSFVLPGLGEYYVGDQIWRGVIFTVLDAGLLYEHFHFIARGNDAVNTFHAFADSLWLPQKYADTLNTLLTRAGNGYQITGDPTAADYFSKIRKAEDSVRKIYGDNGAFPITHSLPDQGSQQFYELISKYAQFAFGWKDFVPGGSQYSPDYETHAFMRQDMNHQFEVASDFIYGMFINRILSMIDAGLLAKDHNTPVHLEGELREQRYRDGMMGFIPTAKFRYTF